MAKGAHIFGEQRLGGRVVQIDVVRVGEHKLNLPQGVALFWGLAQGVGEVFWGKGSKIHSRTVNDLAFGIQKLQLRFRQRIFLKLRQIFIDHD